MLLGGKSAVIVDCPPPIAVVDGDTLRCGDERIRLLGFDAPEFSCPPTRDCAPGDPDAAKAALTQLLRGKVSIVRVGTDRYGRTLAHVYAGGVNVVCPLLRDGHGIYVARWDNDGGTARDCELAEVAGGRGGGR
jgi:endonuclease YncB( thermonuclease family)